MQAANGNSRDFSSLFRSIFGHRSGWIIAASRCVIAVSFIGALWLDPTQPARIDAAGMVLAGLYVTTSFLLLWVSWRSWWFDHVLASPALIFDICVFLAAFYYSERQHSDFVSPFMGSLAFIVLASNNRWGWRTTAWMAAGIGVAYLVVGLEMHAAGLALDMPRFTRRLAFMGIMSFILIWFSSQNQGVRVPRFEVIPDDRQMLFADVLAFAASAIGAKQAALAWSDEEEPRLNISTLGLDDHIQHSYPNDVVNFDRPKRVKIFDALRRRELVLRHDNFPTAQVSQVMPSLNRLVQLPVGLCIPLNGSTGRGQLLLGGIPGLNADHLRVGYELGREIALAMDRFQLTEITSEAAMIRLRGSIARDLHDSVAQSLAGANFRIAALRALVRNGGDPLPELEALHEGLSDEQNHVRSIIRRLRQNEILPGDRDLAHELSVTVAQLERQWGIEIDFPDRSRATPVPAIMVFEIQQLVREGVANAVRHGKASRIEIGLGRGPHALVLTLDDNGSGFAMDEQVISPRSLAERISELGGTLVISSHPGATRIGITLPLKGRT